jgi:hypothetical protein
MAFAVPAVLLVAGPDQAATRPPAAAVSPAPSATAPGSIPASASPSASLAASASAAPSTSPATIATSPIATAPSPQPEPSHSASPRSAQDQILDLRALVSRLEATDQLPSKDADDLDHMLKDLGNLVTEAKQPGALDKLAAMQKKNDSLLAAGKITPAGHAVLKDRLDRLASAISGMPTA